MLKYINYRMRITLTDHRTIVGTFMAFDKHMNMVLGGSEEFRKLKSKKGGTGLVNLLTLPLALTLTSTLT